MTDLTSSKESPEDMPAMAKSSLPPPPPPSFSAIDFARFPADNDLSIKSFDILTDIVLFLSISVEKTAIPDLNFLFNFLFYFFKPSADSKTTSSLINGISSNCC